MTNQKENKSISKEFHRELDRATDSNKNTYLISYECFLDDNIILFCKSINEGEKVLDKFVIENNIWKKCIGVCTDGA